MNKLLKTSLLVPLGVLITALVWSFGTSLIVEHAPAWAWTHGTEAMQKEATKGLIMKISPGSAIEDIVSLLGPGSRGWPSKFTHIETGRNSPETISFGSRSEANFGIIVIYVDGRVVKAEIFD